MTTGKRPVFSSLSPDDTIALLQRNRVGRLAFTFHDRVDIEPISYVYADGWVYLRTSPGTKLTTILHHPWVAFEVDEVKDQYHWRSVVVRGTIYFLDPDHGARGSEIYASALDLMRALDAGLLTSLDVTPERRHLFRIHVDEITGRAATL